MKVGGELCGPRSRFKLTRGMTEAGETWFLADAEVTDPVTGRPAIVRQGTETECRAVVAEADAAEWQREAEELADPRFAGDR